MDRKQQLQNVAFGGAWSEQIAGNEGLKQAMLSIENAVERTGDEDLRADQGLALSLAMVTKAHPKGKELSLSWQKALGLTSGYDRYTALARIARLLREGLGDRLKG